MLPSSPPCHLNFPSESGAFLSVTKQTQAVVTPELEALWAPRFCDQQGPTSLGAPATLPGKPVSLVQQNRLQLSWLLRNQGSAEPRPTASEKQAPSELTFLLPAQGPHSVLPKGITAPESHSWSPWGPNLRGQSCAHTGNLVSVAPPRPHRPLHSHPHQGQLSPNADGSHFRPGQANTRLAACRPTPRTPGECLPVPSATLACPPLRSRFIDNTRGAGGGRAQLPISPPGTHPEVPSARPCRRAGPPGRTEAFSSSSHRS